MPKPSAEKPTAAQVVNRVLNRYRRLRTEHPHAVIDEDIAAAAIAAMDAHYAELVRAVTEGVKNRVDGRMTVTHTGLVAAALRGLGE